MRKFFIILLLLLYISMNCFSWTEEEINNILGKFISQNTFDSFDFDSRDQFYSLANQTLLRRLALSNYYDTYYNVVTRMIEPKIIVYGLDEDENTVVGGYLSKVIIYIAQYEKGIYLNFIICGTKKDDPDKWYMSYEHEIIFTKEQQNGWQTIRTSLTDIRNEINVDFLTIVRPGIMRELSDNRIKPWNIMDRLFRLK